MAKSDLKALRGADTEQVGAYYDEWAHTYDDDLAAFGYQAPQWVAEQIAAVVDDRQAQILDAGCGTGLTGQELKALGYTRLTGIDVSTSSLEIARTKGCYANVQRQNMDQALAFADNSFDAITCVGMLAYIKHSQALMAEFCRVVRPGGFVVFTQSDDFYLDAFTAALEHLVDNGSWTLHAHTGPHPYLPRHPDYGDDTTIYIDTYKVIA